MSANGTGAGTANSSIQSVCLPEGLRYSLGEHSAKASWLDGRSFTYNFQSAGPTGVMKYTERFGNQYGSQEGPVLVQYGNRTGELFMNNTCGSATNRWSYTGEAHAGPGPQPPASYAEPRSLILFQCKGTAEGACQASTNVKPYILVREVICFTTPTSTWGLGADYQVKVGGDSNVGYPLGALGDGYLAAVSETPQLVGAPIWGIRIARLTNNSMQGNTYWARSQLFLAPNETITEIAISQDLVAFLVKTASNHVVRWAAVKDFFDGDAPVATSGDDFVVTQLRDLAVSEHWVTWVRVLTTGDYQVIAASAKLSPIGWSGIVPIQVNRNAQTNLVTRTRPSLHHNFLAWNDGKDLHLKDLITAKEITPWTSANVVGQPVLISLPYMQWIWYFEDTSAAADLIYTYMVQ